MFFRTAISVAILAATAASQVLYAPPAGQLTAQGLRLPPGLGPASEAILADIDNDGLPDLVRAAGLRIEVLLQGEDGRFGTGVGQTQIGFPLPATAITAMAAGDLNGDGWPEVVVGLENDHDLVLVNNGAGRLTIAAPNPLPTNAGIVTPNTILVGNFDPAPGDDVIVTSNGGVTRPLFSNGAAGGPLTIPLANPLPMPARGPNRAAAARDLDGDGDLDLVVSSASSIATYVLENVGGTFTTRYTMNFSASQILVGDFTGTSDFDVMLMSSSIAPQAPVVLEATATFSFLPQVMGWTVAVLDAGVGNVDVNSQEDAVFLERGGRVSVSRGLAPPAALLDVDSRTALDVADVEGDGDLDIVVVGERPPDALLLNDGLGNFLNTERPPVVSGGIPGAQSGIFVGAQPAVDPDLLILRENGGTNYFANIEGARLVPHPSGSPSFVGTDFSVIQASPVSTTAPNDVVVLDRATPDSIRFLSRQSDGSLLDTTANFWPHTGFWFTAVASGRFGVPAFDGAIIADLVFVDILGNLRLFRQQAGVYQEIPNAFAGVSVPGVTQLIVDDFNNDEFDDLCVLNLNGFMILTADNAQAPAISFSVQPTTPVGATALRGEAADLNDDGNLDLLLVTPSAPTSVTVMSGNGSGGFANVSITALGAIGNAITVVDVAVVESLGFNQMILAATAGGELVSLTRSATLLPTWFGLPEIVPLHGSGTITDLVVADVDGDFDEDVAVLREDATPLVLFNRDLQMTSLAVAQVGRWMSLELDADPGDACSVFLSFFPGRLPLFDWGVLRDLNPQTLLTVSIGPTGHASVPFFLPVGMIGLELRTQVAAFRAQSGRIVLGNLLTTSIVNF